MKTSHLARYAGLVAALVLAGCGGGDEPPDEKMVDASLCVNIVGPLRPGTMVPESECVLGG